MSVLVTHIWSVMLDCVSHRSLLDDWCIKKHCFSQPCLTLCHCFLAVSDTSQTEHASWVDQCSYDVIVPTWHLQNCHICDHQQSSTYRLKGIVHRKMLFFHNLVSHNMHMTSFGQHKHFIPPSFINRVHLFWTKTFIFWLAIDHVVSSPKRSNSTERSCVSHRSASEGRKIERKSQTFDGTLSVFLKMVATLSTGWDIVGSESIGSGRNLRSRRLM